MTESGIKQFNNKQSVVEAGFPEGSITVSFERFQKDIHQFKSHELFAVNYFEQEHKMFYECLYDKEMKVRMYLDIEFYDDCDRTAVIDALKTHVKAYFMQKFFKSVRIYEATADNDLKLSRHWVIGGAGWCTLEEAAVVGKDLKKFIADTEDELVTKREYEHGKWGVPIDTSVYEGLFRIPYSYKEKSCEKSPVKRPLIPVDIKKKTPIALKDITPPKFVKYLPSYVKAEKNRLPVREVIVVAPKKSTVGVYDGKERDAVGHDPFVNPACASLLLSKITNETNVDGARSINWEVHRDLIFASVNSGIPTEDILNFSRKNEDKYDETETLRIIGCAKTGDECLDVRTIVYWAKKLNYEEYKKLVGNYDFYKTAMERYPVSINGTEWALFPLDRVIEILREDGMNDMGLAKIFMEMFKGRLKCIDEGGKRFMAWNGFYWDHDSSVDTVFAYQMKQLLERYLTFRANALKKFDEGLAGMDKEDAALVAKPHLPYDKGVFNNLSKGKFKEYRGYLKDMDYVKDLIFRDKLDIKPGILVFSNGALVDLKTLQERRSLPSDMISKAVQFDWKGLSHYDSKDMKVYVKQVAGGDEEESYFSRIFGYGLTQEGSEGVIIILWGEGQNSKSTFINCIQNAVGKEVAVTVSKGLLTRGKYDKGSSAPNPELLSTKGASFLFCTELEKNGELNESTMKSLTSRGLDEVTGRYLYDNQQITFIPKGLPCVATNHKPKVDPSSESIWKRLALAEFTQQFVEPGEVKHSYQHEKNEAFVRKIKENRGGVLKWLIEGAHEWYKNGVQTPPSVVEATKRYRFDQFDALEFINEEFEQGDSTDFISKADLYTLYTEWCGEKNRRAFPSRKFHAHVQERYKEVRGGVTKNARGYKELKPRYTNDSDDDDEEYFSDKEN